MKQNVVRKELLDLMSDTLTISAKIRKVLEEMKKAPVLKRNLTYHYNDVYRAQFQRHEFGRQGKIVIAGRVVAELTIGQWQYTCKIDADGNVSDADWFTRKVKKVKLA